MKRKNIIAIPFESSEATIGKDGLIKEKKLRTSGPKLEALKGKKIEIVGRELNEEPVINLEPITMPKETVAENLAEDSYSTYDLSEVPEVKSVENAYQPEPEFNYTEPQAMKEEFVSPQLSVEQTEKSPYSFENKAYEKVNEMPTTNNFSLNSVNPTEKYLEELKEADPKTAKGRLLPLIVKNLQEKQKNIDDKKAELNDLFDEEAEIKEAISDKQKEIQQKEREKQEAEKEASSALADADEYDRLSRAASKTTEEFDKKREKQEAEYKDYLDKIKREQDKVKDRIPYLIDPIEEKEQSPVSINNSSENEEDRNLNDPLRAIEEAMKVLERNGYESFLPDEDTGIKRAA